MLLFRAEEQKRLNVERLSSSLCKNVLSHAAFFFFVSGVKYFRHAKNREALGNGLRKRGPFSGTL